MASRKKSDYWMKSVTDEVLSWPRTSKHPERYGGNAFRVGRAEVGHIHHGGAVHIPFSRPVRDELLSQGLAAVHPYAPDTGNVSFQMNKDEDLQHAIWLMRLSYLRYALKQAADPALMLDEESERLKLDPRLRALMQAFVRPRPSGGPADPNRSERPTHDNRGTHPGQA
jgi:luciferase-like monooxygenase